jgi:predicted RecA/RadA family phage recombinase
MAANRNPERGRQLSVVVSDPANPTSGSPVRVGSFCAVALTDERSDGTTSVQTDGVFTLSVKGVDAGGNAAVAVGDVLYYVDADTPKLSKKNTGTRFGYALEAVQSGATASIKVKLGY